MHKNGYDLIKIIKEDFLRYKMHLFLFIAIILSACSIILVVHYTSLLIIQKEELIMQKKAIQISRHHVIIEKSTWMK